MAIDNLNFYSNGIPAGQQTDSYTTQPGCLLSKNVDIFSSSKSIKATAFSEPTTQGNNIIDTDDRGRLELHDNGKIWDNEANDGQGAYILDPMGNFPVNNINYVGRYAEYSPAQYGEPKRMLVKYNGDTLKSVVVFTDRTQYNWQDMDNGTSEQYSSQNLDYDGDGAWTGKTNTNKKTGWIRVICDNLKGLTDLDLNINIHQDDESLTNISIDYIQVHHPKYYYDAEMDSMIASGNTDVENITDLPELNIHGNNVYTLPMFPTDDVTNGLYILFRFTPKEEGGTDYSWRGTIVVSLSQYNEYYNYLNYDASRDIYDIGQYYWMKTLSFQRLYNWDAVWKKTDVLGKDTQYTLTQYMGWENDTSMDIVSLVEYNEQVYMIGNMGGNGYIIPCDLSGGKGVATVKYGCQFLWAINKDYLLYLVGTDRGVSTLWVFNGHELVSVISGSQEVSSKDLVDNVEQYRFDGSMVIYRNNLILGTTDNRLFRYGQTYGGRGGSFIYVLPSGATLDKLEARNNDLIIHYTLNQTKYQTVYQDDVPIKRFNTEYEVVYPIVIGNHILEKEDTDLYVSYLLPSANTSLEFWAMNNHYQYWTFTSEDNVTLDTTKNYTMSGAGGTYALKFIERNGNQYTFELDGNLPVQTSNEMKIKDNENTVVLNYTSYNHFRLIGTLSTDKCEESKFRFTGLNNKLNLTKTHSMQIMVKGKGTTQYTPELFALNLVATQRDRG